MQGQITADFTPKGAMEMGFDLSIRDVYWNVL